MESLKKQFDGYKDKVVDNYEYWFASVVLEDILEIGGFETLIDEQYEFLFNVDLSEKLQQIINDNLHEIDKSLLIDFIKLKRITDKRIFESRVYDKKFVEEYIFQDERNNEFNESQEVENIVIQLNPRLKNREIIIEELHTFLFDYGFIEEALSEFKIHFEKNNSGRIIWKKENESLVELILFMNFKELLNPVMKEKNRPFVPIVSSPFSVHFKSRIFS